MDVLTVKKNVANLFLWLIPLAILLIAATNIYALWVVFYNHNPLAGEGLALFFMLFTPIAIVLILSLFAFWRFMKRKGQTRWLLLALFIVQAAAAAWVFFVPFFLYGMWWPNIVYSQVTAIEMIPFLVIFIPYAFIAAEFKRIFIR